MSDTGSLISLLSRKLQAGYSIIRAGMLEVGLTGMDISHGDILFHLYRSGALTMKDLAERIKKDKSTVTALVGKMEKRGLVARWENKEDRRGSYVVLTDKGRGYEPAFREISRQLRKAVSDSLTADEQRELIRLLEKLFTV